MLFFCSVIIHLTAISIIFSACGLTDNDALDIYRLHKMADQGSLISEHLPLSELVCDGHTDQLGGRMIES